MTMEKKELATNLVNELNERHPEVTFKMVECPKYNQIRTGISIEPTADSNVCPIYYLEDHFDEDYFDFCLEEIEKVFFKNTNEFQNVDVKTFLIPQNLRLEVVNAEKNKELVENYLHREYHDLYLIPYFEIEEYNATVKCSPSTCEFINMTDDEVFECAYKNSAELVTITPMHKVINELCDCISEEMEEELKIDSNMLVVTNKSKFLGASAFAIAEVLEQISDDFNADYYILPSSRHEVIALKDDEFCYDGDELKEMVTEINQTAVNTSDYLSDSVYRYSRDTKILSIVA